MHCTMYLIVEESSMGVPLTFRVQGRKLCAPVTYSNNAYNGNELNMKLLFSEMWDGNSDWRFA